MEKEKAHTDLSVTMECSAVKMASYLDLPLLVLMSVFKKPEPLLRNVGSSKSVCLKMGEGNQAQRGAYCLALTGSKTKRAFKAMNYIISINQRNSPNWIIMPSTTTLLHLKQHHFLKEAAKCQ